tara:strand:- start:87 stop:674 length:588 start_codon:yes stop_codon:yes gene_type:complete
MAKGSLFVNIGANISGFKKGLDRSTRMLKGYRKKVARAMPRVPSLGGMAAGLGISIGMAQAFNIMRNASPKFAKSIQGLKEKMLPLARQLGDKLQPLIQKLTNALPEIIDYVFDFAASIINVYTKLQRFAEWLGKIIGKFIGERQNGDPSKGLDREQLEELRGIRSEQNKRRDNVTFENWDNAKTNQENMRQIYG